MIYLAPLQGYTDFIFRNVYSRHYAGIDVAVSPFISLTQGKNSITRIAKDVLPTNNYRIPVIPQLLGNNPEYFIYMANMLHDWGYGHLNWNLGCPVKNIRRKKRGCGLLPFPDLVREILENIIPNIPQRLSVKMRLGLDNPDEIYKLIPVLNEFPLGYIIIHPRVGIQMYEGEVQHDVLQNCIPLIKHEIIYNGDIFTLADYHAIQQLYPTIRKWMIGRGILQNPLLPSIINSGEELSKEKNDEKFLSFILDLYRELKIYHSDNSILDKAKDYWNFFSKRFSESGKVFDIIVHTHSMEEIIRLTQQIIIEEKMNDWNS